MGLPRDIYHVEFGVAVVVFGLVMCGLHPYSFSDPTNRKKIGTPEENLLKGYCPFAPGSKLRFPQAPHDEWAILVLASDLAPGCVRGDLLRRAFQSEPPRLAQSARIRTSRYRAVHAEGIESP